MRRPLEIGIAYHHIVVEAPSDLQSLNPHVKALFPETKDGRAWAEAYAAGKNGGFVRKMPLGEGFPYIDGGIRRIHGINPSSVDPDATPDGLPH